MDAARWERVQKLFHEVADLEPAQRRIYLERHCADPAIIADVLNLVAGDESGHAFLDRGVAKVAYDVLDSGVPVLKSIGPYRIGEVLGRGGMGTVYLAEREDVGSRVAVKVLRDASLSPARRERFFREQKTLAQLNHPSVARLYDAGVLPEGTPYFVMEHVEGLSLTDFCTANACSLRERLHLFQSVCEAVHYAHRQAVVHRDLKPSNIFVTAEGSVKLLDFGIAKQLEGVDASLSTTQTGFQLMTPAYAAPEQFTGEAVGIYTDIYALGVVLYELLTGSLPHDLTDLTPGQIESRIAFQDPERPSLKARDLQSTSTEPYGPAISAREWADLDVLCLTAMHKDPHRRYKSVDAMVRDIGHFLNGEPLDAREDSFAYRSGKFLRRNRAVLSAAAVVLLLVVGVVAFYTMRLADQRNRARIAAAKAEQVGNYLIGLFEAADPFSPQPDDLDIRTLLARGEDRAEALADQPEVQAQMLTVLGRVYTALSEYGRADSLLQRALAIRKARDVHPLEVAETLGNLGNLYRFQAEFERAEEWTRQALAIREKHLDPKHPDVATTLDNLGVILSNRGEYAEGESHYRRALQIRREIYIEPHELLAHSLNNLAVNLANQGNYEAAERYLRESLEVGRAALGSDNASLAADLANLGVVLEIQGNFEAADSALSEAVRINRLRLGDNHYETAFGLTRLGGLLRRAGDHDRAERYLTEAMEIEARILDADHRNAGITRSHLAAVYQDRGDFERAEPLLREAARILGASLGESHEFAAITRCALAHLLHQKGSLAESEILFNECLATLRQTLPPGHDVLAGLQSKFGSLLITAERYDEAEPLLTESFAVLQQQFGDGHPDTREAAGRLARLYDAAGQHEKAETFRKIGEGGPE